MTIFPFEVPTMTRNKNVAFQTDVFDLELEVTASISPGFPGRGPSMDNAGGDPPDPPEVEDLYVGIIIGGVSIDITDKLPEKVRDKIEEQCFENAVDDERDVDDGREE